MEKEIVFVLLDEFADWEAAFLAPALCSGVMPGRPGSYLSLIHISEPTRH